MRSPSPTACSTVRITTALSTASIRRREALTAVTVALLTVYDMCKAVDKGMVIEKVRLVSKTKDDIEELKDRINHGDLL